MGTIRLKRIYESPDAADGKRILVDRLWPRGVAKSAAQVDVWMKDVAPSPELRSWFNHEPAKYAEFSDRYRAELAGDEQRFKLALQLREWSEHEPVTLLYAAKDPVCNHAVVLLDFLEALA